MKSRFYILLGALLSLAASDALCANLQIWTVTETQRIQRSAPPGKRLAVNLGAARNEWESFQILMRSDRQVKGVRVEAGDLRARGGASLGAGGARLFRQHQVYLDVGTYRNDAFKPDWYPDPLIPFQHPVRGDKLETARFRAIPFDLPADETHGFWVDLYVPAEAAPGDYRGVYRVTALGGMTVDIPVTLTVWDFALPRTPTLVTAFGSPARRMRGYYRQKAEAGKEPEPKDWAAVEAQCAQLAARHRVNATPPAESLRPVARPDGSLRIPAEQLNALREFVDRYHVNAIQIPHPSSAVKDPEREQSKLRAWLAAFDRAAKELNRPHVVFFIYLKDEPNTLEDYRYVQKWGRAIRQANSSVKVLVVEQTWTEPGKGGADSAWGNLYGAVDIWCPLFSLFRAESAAGRQALGETIWTYTALCQGQPTPWWHIDYPLMNYRVPAPIAWRHGIKGLLYWGGMSYWRETDDPWAQVPVYTGGGARQRGGRGIVFNGEGSLVYPARAAGYDGIVPTLRLKALRDAIEDYEYLATLERLGKREQAERIVRPLAESWFQWEKNAAVYERARGHLAELIVTAAQPASTTSARSGGPLRVHPTNPRYFTGGSGKAIYLTGSHTWNNLQDSAKLGKPLTEKFDYDGYLRFLEKSNHNFMRMWSWEVGENDLYYDPAPWVRTGPGAGTDGKPKFDLQQFDPEYFQRLRSRVIAARDRGIYVSVMLFQGWSIYSHGYGNPWPVHPFNQANNINGVDGDADRDGEGKEVHTLQLPAVTRLQEAYVRKVIDTVNDLDNVLYEITNETAIFSRDWQYHMIRYIKDYEATKPKQHPVGMSAFDSGREGSMEALFGSPADWISPQNDGAGGDFMHDPPAADGRKIVISDTDHLWGVGGDRVWVWKSFTRGFHTIYMDPITKPDGTAEPLWKEARKAMGLTLGLAKRMNLAKMVPRNDLASTRYCLANPGTEYLVYLPKGGEVTVDLTANPGAFVVEWIHPVDGTVTPGKEATGGDKRELRAPFSGDAVLHIRSQQ
ncbi:MAG: DUF4091 domain-containing protein [Phycisphaerales bacterium]|nr:MAG: DUF4091 domain-containing protein [Phycisphaerales bacterium]